MFSFVRRSISAKLIIGFCLVIVVSTALTGIVFINMFRQYLIGNKEKEIIARGRRVAEAVSLYIKSDGNMRGFRSIIRFIDSFSDAKVWIIDKNGEIVISSRSPIPQTFDQLEIDAIKIINEVLSGKDITITGYSTIYREMMITTGMPVYKRYPNVEAAVIIFAPVEGVTHITSKATSILLFGTAIGIILSMLLGFAYSLNFSKPIKQMNKAALLMAAGNYNIKTQIHKEDEIGQLAHSLNILAEKLESVRKESEKLENMRKEFIANVSHEFRNPLAVIMGSAEAVKDGVVEKKEAEKYLTKIIKETVWLQKLVDELLELGRLQAGKVKLNLKEADIVEIMREVAEKMQIIANRKNIKICFQAEDNLPTVYVDPERIKQLAVILIDNAIKFSYENQNIDITLSHCSITNIKNCNDNTKDKFMKESIVLTIRDYGCGIEQEEIDKIWERFYKSDDSRTGKGGSGLGLAIAKQLIDLHNAQVDVKSWKGKGTEFKLFLLKNASSH